MVKEKYTTFTDGDIELEAKSNSLDADRPASKTDYSVFSVEPSEIGKRSSGIGIVRRESEIIPRSNANFSSYNVQKQPSSNQPNQDANINGVKLSRRSSEMVTTSRHKKTMAVASLFHSDSRNAFSSNLPIDGVELFSNTQRKNRPATLEEAASTMNLRGSANETNNEDNSSPEADLEAEQEDTITSLPNKTNIKVKRHQSVLVPASKPLTAKITRNESDVGSRKPKPIIVPDQENNVFVFSESLSHKGPRETSLSLGDMSQEELREK